MKLGVGDEEGTSAREGGGGGNPSWEEKRKGGALGAGVARFLFLSSFRTVKSKQNREIKRVGNGVSALTTYSGPCLVEVGLVVAGDDLLDEVAGRGEMEVIVAG